jgi:dolichyl-diphosphooligosaccharide--protein glycosyltransferase/undecaprenyl-diphosphooligosaccharide--protein glycosyltransferase
LLKNRSLLSIEESRVSLKMLFIMIGVAYLFSVLVRLIWVFQFQGEASFTYHDQLMINTNDGYWFAEGARDILVGSHQDNDLSPVHSAVSIMTAFAAKILPFSFETIILYMPAFLGSLLVVPVLLIARIFKLSYVGFIAALLASITWSYYNRTMTGYYDSDMLNIVLPTFVLWAIMFNVNKKRNRFLPLVAIFMILYSWWYPQSYSLHLAMAVALLVYTLIFERKEHFNYKIIIIMMISMSMISWVVKLAIIGGLFLLFHYKKEMVTIKTLVGLLLLSILLLVVTGGIAPILAQIKGYLFRESADVATATGFHYYDIVKTVREAGHIPFETFANRISGHTITFILSTIGYILFAIRYPLMWLALPMIGLGFMALKGGLRFTVYAVPINALGLGFLIVWGASFFKEKKFALLFATFLTVLALIPNIKHIIEYRVPTVFNKDEVAVLDKLKGIASREDYVLTWWDYGYPLRYYSDVKTLIDGGKHAGDVNFPVSFALGAKEHAAVNMARLATEYTEKAYREQLKGDYLSMMMKDYHFSDPDDFLIALEDSAFKLPKKTRDVYFYLPYKMMGIFPTVLMFENINLKDGKSKANSFFYYAPRFKDTPDRLYLGNGISMDKKSGLLDIAGQKTAPKRFVTVGYNQEGKVQKRIQEIDPNSPISIIFMQSYGAFLILDEKMYNSSYIQLFVLENYDKSLFEPVIMTPFAKVYKIKK